MMNDYLFHEYLSGCSKFVRETTSYFEAFIFEDPADNVVKDEREVDDRQIEELLSGFNDARAEGCVGEVKLV